MNQMSAPERGDRLAFVDGLRGLAILMVICFHTWAHSTLGQSTMLARAMGQGYQGVSLFLVISGFCLALPPLKRRQAGLKRWFVPSEFFARRCLRILPPYYVALTIFTLVKIIAAHRHALSAISTDPPPNAANIVSHVLLVHNLTSYIYSIAGPFWSLALEWQWYWLFPLILLCCRWSWVGALLGCLGIAVLWHFGTHDLWSIGALPARLFEFCCGVVAAYVVAERRVVAPWRLVLGVLVPFASLALGQHLHWPLFSSLLSQSLYGIAFACLLLLGYFSETANAAYSWRPLVMLGTISYSVYLIHQPIVNGAMDKFQPHLSYSLGYPWAAMVLGALCAILAGAVFHVAIERPCMRRATWLRVGPSLTRLFLWTDWLWQQTSAMGARTRAAAVEPAVASR